MNVWEGKEKNHAVQEEGKRIMQYVQNAVQCRKDAVACKSL